MAVAAGKKLNIVVRTVVTLFEARAESGGATGADVSEHFALGRGERASPAGEEFLCVLTKDIGHFQPMFSHDWGALSPVLSMGLMGAYRKGCESPAIVGSIHASIEPWFECPNVRA